MRIVPGAVKPSVPTWRVLFAASAKSGAKDVPMRFAVIVELAPTETLLVKPLQRVALRRLCAVHQEDDRLSLTQQEIRWLRRTTL